MACCVQEGKAGVGAGMGRCLPALKRWEDHWLWRSHVRWGQLVRTTKKWGIWVVWGAGSAVAHFLGSRVQSEILSRGLLLELEQELVQMCLADYYVGISNFSPWSRSAVQPDKAVTVVEGCKSNCTWWKQWTLSTLLLFDALIHLHGWV